ncbi:hypothetical protein LXL04_001873 [Taraxacum kok-saghyz]
MVKYEDVENTCGGVYTSWQCHGGWQKNGSVANGETAISKAILKAIWDARNELIFHNKARTKEFIFTNAQIFAFNWLSDNDDNLAKKTTNVVYKERGKVVKKVKRNGYR